MSADIADLVASLAAAAGPDEQIEAYASRGSSTEVRVWRGQVEHFVSAASEGVGVRVVSGGRTGFAYAGTLEADAVAEVLAEARENVAYGTADPDAGVAEPDGVEPVDIELWSDELDRFATADKIELALELERMVLAMDPRIRVDDANYIDGGGEMAVATSTGIVRHRRGNSCHVSVSTLADDGDETQTGFGYSIGDHPGEFDLEWAAREAVERATRLLGAEKPPSERTTVIFDPFVTAQLLSIIGSTLNGEAVVRGRSLFADRVGDVIASELVTLIDDPTDVRAYTATDVDGEGLATRRNVLIDAGRLDHFVQSTYSARRAGVVSTGNGVRGGYSSTPGTGCLALQLVPGARSRDDLIADVDHGVLVQSLSGVHSGVNTVSGDVSVGATGMTIRNGALATPVREFTVASTIQRLLTDVVEVGGDIEWLPSRAAGVSLVVRDVSVSGTS
jgi:PmbA protein